VIEILIISGISSACLLLITIISGIWKSENEEHAAKGVARTTISPMELIEE